MTKLRLGAVMALVGLFTAFVIPMGTANAQVTLPVSGTCMLPGGEPGQLVNSSIDIERFVVRQGDLFAVVDGTVTCVGNTTGTTVTRTLSNVRLPVDTAQSSGTCDILDLHLGPLDLDLLGLVVHLDQVNLHIEAQQGPGNLLGNLLCAVAGLLDNSGGNGLAGLLNQILGILG